MVLGTKDQYKKALDKARKLGMVAKVRPAGAGLYTVPSNTDPSVRYTVEVRGSEYLCNCLAAGRGLPCCHSASVWKYRLTERSVKPVAPKPAVSTSARAAIWGEEAYR